MLWGARYTPCEDEQTRGTERRPHDITHTVHKSSDRHGVEPPPATKHRLPDFFCEHECCCLRGLAGPMERECGELVARDPSRFPRTSKTRTQECSLTRSERRYEEGLVLLDYSGRSPPDRGTNGDEARDEAGARRAVCQRVRLMHIRQRVQPEPSC